MSAEIVIRLSASGGLEALVPHASGDAHAVGLPQGAEGMATVHRMLLALARHGRSKMGQPGCPTQAMIDNPADTRWYDIKPVRYGQGSNAKPLASNAEDLGL